MSGKVLRTERNITYTITHPEWICEWILPFDKTKAIKNSFILTNGKDLSDMRKGDYIMKIIPGIFTDVQSIVRGWIEMGDINASLLLTPENKPPFILYAENTIGLKIIT